MSRLVLITYYGRWDAAARAHDAAESQQVNEDVAEDFAAEGLPAVFATRRAGFRYGGSLYTAGCIQRSVIRDLAAGEPLGTVALGLVGTR
jgi:hypothetical protein